MAARQLGMLVFFVDPRSPVPRDLNVKAATRLAIVYGIPSALDRATPKF